VHSTSSNRRDSTSHLTLDIFNYRQYKNIAANQCFSESVFDSRRSVLVIANKCVKPMARRILMTIFHSLCIASISSCSLPYCVPFLFHATVYFCVPIFVEKVSIDLR
jgi:hypothetical protein